VIRKEGVATVIPHQNWRGQFARGTYPSGAVSDCGPGQTTGCTPIDWPGYRTTAWHVCSGDGPDIRTWFGGLVDDMRDASGQMYRRNRYYDPATGQFTQADPMGLAGGLNAYGFADGDPVSYSDPYGLSVDSIYVRGSAGFRRTVINGLLTLANRQPWFRHGYDAIAGSSTHHIYIREQPCRRGFGNCQGMVNRRIGYIDLAPNMNALQLVTSAGHELVHAMGDLSRVLKTGIDAECGREDSSSNGCIAYYDNLNRDALGVRNIDDEDGRRFARERGLPMWTGDDPMQREHRPAGTP
jgi:RHS repeat-associated protein